MRAIKNLIGAVLISIAVLLVWVVILPDYDRRSYLELAVQVRSANLEEKNKLISKVEELDKEYQSRYAELKRLSLVVPSEKHLEEMITIVEDIFSATGVTLSDISLSAQEDPADYNSVGTEFRFKATYDSVMNFLNVVEKSLRLIDVTSLDMSMGEDSSGGGSLPLSVTMRAHSYFLSKTIQAKASTQPAVSDEE